MRFLIPFYFHTTSLILSLLPYHFLLSKLQKTELKAPKDIVYLTKQVESSSFNILQLVEECSERDRSVQALNIVGHV